MVAANSAAQVSTVLNTGRMPARSRSSRTPSSPASSGRSAASWRSDSPCRLARRSSAGVSAGALDQLGPQLDERRDLVDEPRVDAARGRRPRRRSRRPAAPARRGRAGRRSGTAARASSSLAGRSVLGRGPEAGGLGLHRAQRLAQRLGEVAADRHRLADALHVRGQHRVGARELLEREPRHLDHDVVQRRLERGRRLAGDVVGDLVERVADGQLGRDLGDREAGGLATPARDERDTRGFISITIIRPVRRVDRELDVAAAGVDADLAQHGDADVAHVLVLAVGERHGRRDGDRVAGVHAHRVDVLDRADHDDVVVAVAHQLELELLPAEHRLLDQHLVHRAGGQAAGDHRRAPRPRRSASPEPSPPIVNDGRMTTRLPTVAANSMRLVEACGRPATRAPRRRPCGTISLNRWRSSPRWIASMSAPISSTPYFSSTPFSCSATARLSAVWPPSVGSSASRMRRRARPR